MSTACLPTSTSSLGLPNAKLVLGDNVNLIFLMIRPFGVVIRVLLFFLDTRSLSAFRTNTADFFVWLFSLH